ncbi:HDOD domain-containing protein [Leeia sp. TBRC 13508]|uniref:HDOD domain-containing protein n=1 Tax=Leeia speluncae TaxID=2884804 RepID=A0ABS8D5X2_9NEIS|nr:HDOD domain-containing protein [Leeia speluncae]MCB6183610.1 HDOD domain-containing protein [Leeia speluncae]
MATDVKISSEVSPVAANFVKSWQKIPWPARLTTLEQLRSAKTQTSMTTGKLAAIIEHDPFISMQLIGFVNSSPRGNFASDVTTIEHAIMLMGFDQFFERFGRRMPVEKLLEKEPVRLGQIRERIAICEFAGLIALELANLRNDSKAEEVSVAAMLHDIIEPLLLLSHPDKLGELKEFSLSNRIWQEESLQRSRFGCSYAEMRHALMSQYGMPSMFHDMMDASLVEHPRTRTVLFAVEWAHAAWHGTWTPALQQSLAAFGAALMKPVDVIWHRLTQVTLRLARQGAWNGLSHPAMWLPMLPGDWPLPKVAAPKHAWPDVKVVEKTITQLEQSASELDVGQVMTILFRGVRLGIGLDRVALLVQPKGSKVLKPRFIVGLPDDHPLHSTELSLDTPHVLTKLAMKTQGLWFGNHNRSNLSKFLPAAFADEQNRDWFAMSIWVHGHPLGVLYADGGSHRPHLDEPSYQAFKQLSQAALTALEHSTKPH